MRRGTSPSISFKIKGYDVADFDTVHVTIRQNDIILTKTEAELDIGQYYNTITCNLSQKETLMFKAGVIEIQLRAITKYDDAFASPIYETTLDRILEEGII